MQKIIFTFPSNDGKTDIKAIKYIPEKEIKAILQISHGMVEFLERYEDFALYLNERGILVVGNDHLGHGDSVTDKSEWGYFGKEKGYLNVLTDLHTLTLKIKEEYPDIPYFLLGHSMGSFYARRYLFTYPEELTGAIIMGTGYKDKLTLIGGKFLTKLMMSFKGDHYRSKFINNIALGTYNKKWEPSKTHNDWLTKDEKIVDWYSKEEKCTFIFTLNGFYNLFSVLDDVCNKDNIAKMDKYLPVLFVSGADDPVGDFSKGVLKVITMFKEAGMKNVFYKLYPNDRHEILNETDKDVVQKDIFDFLESNIE